MDWIQIGKGRLSSTNFVSSTSNDKIIVANVTVEPGLLTAVFSCVITSSEFPNFSHNCTIGPFEYLPAVTVTIQPESDTNERLSRTTMITVTIPSGPVNYGTQETPLVKQQQSRGTARIMISVGTPVILLCTLSIAAVVVVVVFKKRKQNLNVTEPYEPYLVPMRNPQSAGTNYTELDKTQIKRNAYTDLLPRYDEIRMAASTLSSSGEYEDVDQLKMTSCNGTTQRCDAETSTPKHNVNNEYIEVY